MNKSGVEPTLANSELYFLYELLRTYSPHKIVTMGVSEEVIAFISNRIRDIGSNCQVSTVDVKNCLVQLEQLGQKIDFLVVDATRNMPEDILDFIMAFPYLTQNAVVVLQDAVLQSRQDGSMFASSILFQAVEADRFTHNQALYPDVRNRVRLSAKLLEHFGYRDVCIQSRPVSNIFSAFQLNELTVQYIGNLFAALQTDWLYMPNTRYLDQCREIISKQYSDCQLQLYLRAVSKAAESADPYRKVLTNVAICFRSLYPKTLLYGKGKWGTRFLELARIWDIPVDGFIISDGHPFPQSYQGLPVYPYSQIPYNRDDVLIIQTVNSDEVAQLLHKSGFHWVQLPEDFWSTHE